MKTTMQKTWWRPFFLLLLLCFVATGAVAAADGEIWIETGGIDKPIAGQTYEIPFMVTTSGDAPLYRVQLEILKPDNAEVKYNQTSLDYLSNSYGIIRAEDTTGILVGLNLSVEGENQVFFSIDVTPDQNTVKDVALNFTVVNIGEGKPGAVVTKNYHATNATLKLYQTHTITATAGEHGKIDPSGEVKVVRDGSQMFSIEPETGYKISDVLVDRNSVGAVETYTFENVNEAHTIEAQFEPEIYTITYEGLNGAENSNNPTSYTVETLPLTLADPGERTGYMFAGWYNGATPVTEIPVGTTGDLTLTATWTAIPYEITYEGLNGAENSNNPTSYTVETLPLTLAEPGERAGYTFAGWLNGATPVTEIPVGTTGALTFTAQWTLVPYDITYEGLEGAENSNNPTSYTVETLPLTLADPGERTGYTFAGWLNGATPVTEIPVGTIGDLTLTATWTAIPYDITYEDLEGAENSNNPTSYTVETLPLTLAEPGERAGYTFAGWFNGATPVTEIPVGTTGALTLTATWTVATYGITYEGLEGATNSNNPTSYTVEVLPITLAEPGERTGYTFAGWLNGATPVTEIPVGTTGDLTLTATWTAIPYEITYEGLNGAENSNNPTSYTVETLPLTLAEPGERAGYTFAGWFNGATPVTEIPVGTATPLTLTAKWSAVSYSISYANVITSHTNPDTYTIESADITLTAPTERIGYTFEGWFDGETKVETIATGSTGNKALTAKWTPILYSISYANVITSHTNPDTYTIESADIILTAPTERTGYTFEGWFDGETKVEKIEAGSTGNKALTAKWTLNTYTVLWKNYDGSVLETDEHVPHGTVPTYDQGTDPVKPTDARYTYSFKDWTPAISAVTGNTEYTAVFDATLRTYDITVAPTVNGTVNVPTQATVDDIVTITVTPEEGFELDTITVTTENGEPVTLTGYTFQMPTSNVTVSAVFKHINYTVDRTGVQNGTVTSSHETAHKGEIVTLTLAELHAGHIFNNFVVVNESGNTVPVTITGSTTATFVMPANHVSVTLDVTKIDYTITVTPSVNGTAAAPATAQVGDKVTVTVTPESGYQFSRLNVTSETGQTITATGKAFVMPAENVIVNAEFTKIPPAPPAGSSGSTGSSIWLTETPTPTPTETPTATPTETPTVVPTDDEPKTGGSCIPYIIAVLGVLAVLIIIIIIVKRRRDDEE